jgi:hypothetical protein
MFHAESLTILQLKYLVLPPQIYLPLLVSLFKQNEGLDKDFD